MKMLLNNDQRLQRRHDRIHLLFAQEKYLCERKAGITEKAILRQIVPQVTDKIVKTYNNDKIKPFKYLVVLRVGTKIIVQIKTDPRKSVFALLCGCANYTKMELAEWISTLVIEELIWK